MTFRHLVADSSHLRRAREKSAAVVFVLLLLIASLGLPCLSRGNESNAQQIQAIDLYRQGNYDTAAALYEKISEEKPDSVAALKDWVWMLWLGKRYGELLRPAQRLTVLTPTNFDAWLIDARSLSATGHEEEALQAFMRCRQLAPQEKNVRFAIARTEAALKHYDQAAVMFEQLVKEDPKNGALYPELAGVEQMQEHYTAAEKNWDLAAQFFPDRPEYRFQQAETQYYGGEQASGLVAMKTLASGAPPYQPATEFLINDAIVRGDLKKAERLLSVTLSTVTVASESGFVRLATLHQSDGDPATCVDIAQRVIDSDPLNGDALYLKGECLKQNHKDLEAIILYEGLLKNNPTSLRGWTSLADSYASLGQNANALQAMEKAYVLDPTNPYLLLQRSQYLYDAQNHNESKKILAQWIQENPDRDIPVLLYHGLTPIPLDVLLASPIHLPVDRFDDHMKALHDAGFHSITIEDIEGWYHGKNLLPSNPVLISFDDARNDSFRYGDPILEKYRFTATMFAPLIDVEGHFSGYADWSALERYQKTGRWDIQAHGDRAHQMIVIDAQGHKGLFLINRQWLPREGRLETVDDWSRRITDDHRSLKAKMHDHLGTTPIAYAWPEGEYGQDSLSNASQTVELNTTLTREAFDLGFHQDAYGLNPRSRDPMRLTRLEPHAAWSGDELVAYLREQDPKILMMRRLLRQAAWDVNTHEADYWLDEMKKSGASPANLLADEARIQLALGQNDDARRLAEQSLRLEDDPETRKLLKEIKTEKPLLWEPTLMYQEDNRGRERWAFYQRLGDWKSGTTGWSVHQLAGVYQERNAQNVDEFSGGIGIDQPLGLYHDAKIDVTGHHFTSTTAKDTYSLIGSVHSNWTDYVHTQAEGGRTIYNTARAIDANVIIRYADLTLFWTPNAIWSASFRDRFGDFTDTNHDYLEVLQVSRQTTWQPLKVLFRFTGDNMTFVSPDYYSPQDLRDYQTGLEFSAPLGARWKADLTYLPGVGTEKGTGAEFIQDLDAAISYQATAQLLISPEIALSQTPTYFSSTYLLKLLYNF